LSLLFVKKDNRLRIDERSRTIKSDVNKKERAYIRLW